MGSGIVPKQHQLRYERGSEPALVVYPKFKMRRQKRFCAHCCRRTTHWPERKMWCVVLACVHCLMGRVVAHWVFPEDPLHRSLLEKMQTPENRAAVKKALFPAWRDPASGRQF